MTRVFRGDEEGVSEVVGFLITFGISVMLLISSLAAMAVVRDFADESASARQVQEVAARVQERVLKAANAAQMFPEADFEAKVPLPAAVGAQDYWIELVETDVRVTASSGRSAALPLLNVARDLVFCGTDPTTSNELAKCRASSDEGELLVIYRDTDPDPLVVKRELAFAQGA